MSNITSNIINIAKNSHRPLIDFNATTGVFKIEGVSILENAIRFYEPILEWVDEYSKNPAKTTILNLELEYFNTSTSKFLLLLIEKLDQLYNSGKDVKIFWHNTDEDMEELGEDFKNLVTVPFKTIKPK